MASSSKHHRQQMFQVAEKPLPRTSNSSYHFENDSRFDQMSMAAKSVQPSRKKAKQTMLEQLMLEEAGACALDFPSQKVNKTHKSKSRSKSKRASLCMSDSKHTQIQKQPSYNQLVHKSNSLLAGKQYSQYQAVSISGSTSYRRISNSSTIQDDSSIQVSIDQQIRDVKQKQRQRVEGHHQASEATLSASKRPTDQLKFMNRLSQRQDSQLTEKISRVQDELNRLGVTPLGQLVDARDQISAASATLQSVSELIRKVFSLASKLSQLQASQAQWVQQCQVQAHQEGEMAAIKSQNSRLEQEVITLRSELAAKDFESRKHASGSLKDANKLEAKMVHMKHEIRRQELENEKLRQTLREKLSLRSTETTVFAKTAKKPGQDDEFYEMVRDGLFEQMITMNAEMQKSQQFSMRLTKWLFDEFKVKVLRQMSDQELDTRLKEITARLNKERTIVKDIQSQKSQSQESPIPVVRNIARVEISDDAPHFGGGPTSSQRSPIKRFQEEPYGVVTMKIKQQPTDEELKQMRQNSFQQGQDIATAPYHHSQLSSQVSKPHPAKTLSNTPQATLERHQKRMSISQSISPFSQMQSEFGMSNALSNNGKGTTFFFDSDE